MHLPKQQILIIDNYDSFTYNLVHLVEKVTEEKIAVLLNDAFEVEDLNKYTHIIVSPGPGLPEQAGKTLQVIKKFAATKNILGVCLGHQAIAVAFGGELKNLNEVYHGVATTITIKKEALTDVRSLFYQFPPNITVGRYHSWVVDAHSLPANFIVTAVDDSGYIMAMKHNIYNLQSVQFHPESIMTAVGEDMLRNWLQ